MSGIRRLGVHCIDLQGLAAWESQTSQVFCILGNYEFKFVLERTVTNLLYLCINVHK